MSTYKISWVNRLSPYIKPPLLSAYDPSKLYSITINNTNKIGIGIDTTNRNTFPLISKSKNTKIKLGDQIVSINDISMFNLKANQIRSIFKTITPPFTCTFISNKPLSGRGGQFKSRSTKQKYSRVTRKYLKRIKNKFR